MAVIDKVTFTNDTGTTYETVGEAIAALEKANPHIFDTYKAMTDRATELGIETKYKVVNDEFGSKERIVKKAEEGDEIDDWPAHTYESQKQELTEDSTGFRVARVWTDEMWTDAQSVPAPTIGNGWTRTATFETINEETSIITENLSNYGM